MFAVKEWLLLNCEGTKRSSTTLSPRWPLEKDWKRGKREPHKAQKQRAANLAQSPSNYYAALRYELATTVMTLSQQSTFPPCGRPNLLGAVVQGFWLLQVHADPPETARQTVCNPGLFSGKHFSALPGPVKPSSHPFSVPGAPPASKRSAGRTLPRISLPLSSLRVGHLEITSTTICPAISSCN